MFVFGLYYRGALRSIFCVQMLGLLQELCIAQCAQMAAKYGHQTFTTAYWIHYSLGI